VRAHHHSRDCAPALEWQLGSGARFSATVLLVFQIAIGGGHHPHINGEYSWRYRPAGLFSLTPHRYEPMEP